MLRRPASCSWRAPGNVKPLMSNPPVSSSESFGHWLAYGLPSFGVQASMPNAAPWPAFAVWNAACRLVGAAPLHAAPLHR